MCYAVVPAHLQEEVDKKRREADPEHADNARMRRRPTPGRSSSTPTPPAPPPVLRPLVAKNSDRYWVGPPSIQDHPDDPLKVELYTYVAIKIREGERRINLIEGVEPKWKMTCIESVKKQLSRFAARHICDWLEKKMDTYVQQLLSSAFRMAEEGWTGENILWWFNREMEVASIWAFSHIPAIWSSNCYLQQEILGQRTDKRFKQLFKGDMIWTRKFEEFLFQAARTEPLVISPLGPAKWPKTFYVRVRNPEEWSDLLSQAITLTQ